MYSERMRIAIALACSLACHLCLLMAGQIQWHHRAVSDEVYETMLDISPADFDQEAVKSRIHNKKGFFTLAPLELYLLEDAPIKLKKIKIE